MKSLYLDGIDVSDNKRVEVFLLDFFMADKNETQLNMAIILDFQLCEIKIR